VCIFCIVILVREDKCWCRPTCSVNIGYMTTSFMAAHTFWYKDPRIQHKKNQPTNQPRKNQPTNRPTDQPTNQPNNQQTNRPTDRPTNQPNNSIHLSPSSEANSTSTSQDIPRILRNPNVHYSIHNFTTARHLSVFWAISSPLPPTLFL